MQAFPSWGRKSAPGMLEPVVIEQDEDSDLRVQPTVQSGRRQIDIRLWRRGPSGFAPSRNALTVEAPDLVALVEGISELLVASNGARQVARVVWDRDEGRRLRAEMEPFGTRFLARLGFWQRVRNTWRPADDGLVVAADLLQPLLGALEQMRAQFLEAAESDLGRPVVALDPEHEKRWPSPGADWITIEPDRIAFHPRGVRITVNPVNDAHGHRLSVLQWRREDSIWLPSGDPLQLSLGDVDGLLSRLRDEPIDAAPLEHADISLRVCLDTAGTPVLLRIEEMREGEWTARIVVPAEHASRVGRLLAQCGALLLMQLSPTERDALLARPEGPVVSADIVEDALAIVEPDAPAPAEAEPEAVVEAPETGDSEPALLAPDGDEAVDREPERRTVALADLHLGQQAIVVQAYLLDDEALYLALQWAGGSLAVPIGHASRMLEDLRQLYYDALRGRRGHVSTVPGSPATHMSIHSHGAGIYVMLDQESGDRMTSLLFPVREVPTFLNAADGALRRIRREEL